METVQIDFGPGLPGYPGAEEAIAAAKQHPAQKWARQCSFRLNNASVIGGRWDTATCAISFSNGLVLFVEAREFAVHWNIGDGDARDPSWRCEAVKLNWPTGTQSVFDPGRLIQDRLGAALEKLWVNEGGLILYTRRNPILSFHAVRALETSTDFLFAASGY